MTASDEPIDAHSPILEHGLQVQDVTAENIMYFSQGKYHLVLEDLKQLPQEASDAILSMFKEFDVEGAYVVRRELINFKKVCLHLYQESHKIARDLTQLATFFFVDVEQLEAENGGFRHSERYTSLSVAKSECKGVSMAAHDFRQFTKTLCCISRHPDCAKRPTVLSELPASLGLTKMLIQASKVLSGISIPVLESQDFEHLNVPVGESWLALSRRLDASGLPVEIVELAKCSMIARGGFKALCIRDELNRYVEFVAAIISRIGSALEEKTSISESSDVKQEVQSTKHLNLLRGAHGVCIDVAQNALKLILEAPKECIFVAGDSKANALCLPKWSLTNTLARYRDAFKHFRADMDAAIEACGWPPASGTSEIANAVGSEKCRICSGRFRSLWVNNAVCCICEPKERKSGRCPFKKTCLAFCPHEGRCPLCDSWSCERCRLVRGDGEDVASFASQWFGSDSSFLFLDFDRTLCTTKNGELPSDKHSLDSELVSLSRQHSTHIVTRNPHQVEIDLFLRERGLTIPVSSVKRLKTTKAAVILSTLDAAEAESGVSCRAVFADDDVREICAPELVQDARVLRVLFVRGL